MFGRLNQLPALGFGCNIAPIFSGSDVFLTAQPTRFSE
ncbi:hypothetical protein D515_01266 [Grimontia indica]|uniref:Uncharacterized protein n=1 Tax=Grimontia indica TaxID=1056512 RepID=R1IPV5_9GAMM|nr:hypothetical protein D515_01266 [Grimontia indica]